jgi:hypothetical protein
MKEKQNLFLRLLGQYLDAAFRSPVPMCHHFTIRFTVTTVTDPLNNRRFTLLSGGNARKLQHEQ